MQQPRVGALGPGAPRARLRVRVVPLADDVERERVGVPVGLGARRGVVRGEPLAHRREHGGLRAWVLRADHDDRHAEHALERLAIDLVPLGVHDVGLRHDHQQRDGAREQLARQAQPEAEPVAIDHLHDERDGVGPGAREERARDPLVGGGVDRRVERVDARQIDQARVAAPRQRHGPLEHVRRDAGEVADVGVASGEAVVQGRFPRVGPSDQHHERCTGGRCGRGGGGGVAVRGHGRRSMRMARASGPAMANSPPELKRTCSGSPVGARRSTRTS